MQLVDVGASLGRVHLWVREGNPGPVVVAVNGFAAPRIHWWLAPEGYDAACIDLPGAGPPALDETSVPAFATAIDEALGRALPGRAFVKVGVSLGAVVALHLRTPGPIVAAEPFLQSAPLWPLHEQIARDRWMWSPEGQRWADALFGAHDYRPALQALRDPAHVLVGDVPLEPVRPIYGMPSLVSAADRAAFAAHPLVHLETVSGGHELPQAPIRAAILRALSR